MTTLSQPQFLDTDHLSYDQLLVIHHLIQGGCKRTPIAAATPALLAELVRAIKLP